MEFTDEQLEQVKAHAKDLLPWQDIAYLMALDVAEFKIEFDNHSSKLYVAYRVGVAERKKQLREPILKMAEHGSPQAELLADKLIEEQHLAESDEL